MFFYYFHLKVFIYISTLLAISCTVSTSCFGLLLKCYYLSVAHINWLFTQLPSLHIQIDTTIIISAAQSKAVMEVALWTMKNKYYFDVSKWVPNNITLAIIIKANNYKIREAFIDVNVYSCILSVSQWSAMFA